MLLNCSPAQAEVVFCPGYGNVLWCLIFNCWKKVFFLHNFVYVFAFVHYICTDIAAETKKTIIVIAIVCSQLTCSAVCFSEMNGASFTCLPKFNRPPGWRAAGLSFVSYHPNVDWTMLDKHFLVDLSTGLLKAPKFFFIGWICRALTAIKTSWERLTSSRCALTSLQTA